MSHQVLKVVALCSCRPSA